MPNPHVVVARFYEHIEPIDRGRYEDPVQAALEHAKAGHECLAVYLDGISLPDDVYADLDFDAVVAEIGAAAGPDSYHGCAQGNEETGLFFFGSNAEDVFARVEPVLRRLPIGQNVRVVIGHGKNAQNPREVRMPQR